MTALQDRAVVDHLYVLVLGGGASGDRGGKGARVSVADRMGDRGVDDADFPRLEEADVRSALGCLREEPGLGRWAQQRVAAQASQRVPEGVVGAGALSALHALERGVPFGVVDVALAAAADRRQVVELQAEPESDCCFEHEGVHEELMELVVVGDGSHEVQRRPSGSTARRAHTPVGVEVHAG